MNKYVCSIRKLSGTGICCFIGVRAQTLRVYSPGGSTSA